MAVTTALLTTLLLAFTLAAPTLNNRQHRNGIRHAQNPPQSIPPYPTDDYTYSTSLSPIDSSVGYALPSGFAALSGYALPSGTGSTHPPLSVITAPGTGDFHPPHTIDTGPFTLPTMTSTPASTSTTISAGPLGTGSSNGSAPCAPNGALICNGLYQFGLCNWGRAVWQDVAPETACHDGRIDFAPGYPL